MPRISVVIPCLNEAAICVERLDALQPLRWDGHELILVDGGSDDQTPMFSRSLVDLVLASPPGRAAQMNHGAGVATGEVLWFLHLDSQPPADAFSQLLREAIDGPGWGRFDIRLSGGRPVFRLIEGMMNLRSCLTGMVTGDQGMFVRRDLFERVGGFPPIALMEDLAISKRLKRIARPACVHARMVTSSRRWERNGVWRTITLMWFLRSAYHLGINPDRLARLYYPCASQMRAS
ncbi:MAG: TIGR04283 family arsenosugar biosynthesis glycosyltransferase [Chromatiaceae bacterium]|jgi:rSAM/selenodomain-associated transferase 2|nr:TIGR04283 family arsenosugar biosynthesis glycosyltransferase [Chromatiaceae bacterium]